MPFSIAKSLRNLFGIQNLLIFSNEISRLQLEKDRIKEIVTKSLTNQRDQNAEKTLDKTAKRYSKRIFSIEQNSKSWFSRIRSIFFPNASKKEQEKIEVMKETIRCIAEYKEKTIPIEQKPVITSTKEDLLTPQVSLSPSFPPSPSKELPPPPPPFVVSEPIRFAGEPQEPKNIRQISPRTKDLINEELNKLNTYISGMKKAIEPVKNFFDLSEELPKLQQKQNKLEKKINENEKIIASLNSQELIETVMCMKDQIFPFPLISSERLDKLNAFLEDQGVKIPDRFNKDHYKQLYQKKLKELNLEKQRLIEETNKKNIEKNKLLDEIKEKNQNISPDKYTDMLKEARAKIDNSQTKVSARMVALQKLNKLAETRTFSSPKFNQFFEPPKEVREKPTPGPKFTYDKLFKILKDNPALANQYPELSLFLDCLQSPFGLIVSKGSFEEIVLQLQFDNDSKTSQE